MFGIMDHFIFFAKTIHVTTQKIGFWGCEFTFLDQKIIVIVDVYCFWGCKYFMYSKNLKIVDIYF